MENDLAEQVYQFVDQEIRSGAFVPGIPLLIHSDIQTYRSPLLKKGQKKYLLEQIQIWYAGFSKFKDDKIAPASKGERQFGTRLSVILK